MATSQNGWLANDRSVIATYTVPGTSVRVPLRKGDASVLLLDFAAWWDREIEDLDGTADDWGYAERTIRGSSTTLSNHASGTAIDLNAQRRPLGQDPSRSLSAEQIRKIRAKIATYDGCLRWGGDYTGRKDPMHVEINKGAAAVKVVADRIRGGSQPAPASGGGSSSGVVEEGARGADVGWIQGRLRVHGIDVEVDNAWGPKTTVGVRSFQARRGLVVDGKVGPITRAALAAAPPAPPAPAGRATIKRGSTGPLVGDLQQRLNRDYPAYRSLTSGKLLAVDNDFGPSVEKWVRQFQRLSGLTVDGEVGPKTWAKLGF